MKVGIKRIVIEVMVLSRRVNNKAFILQRLEMYALHISIARKTKLS